MNGDRGKRLAKLETIYQRPRMCKTCHGYPVRIVCIDEDTDTFLSETYPGMGCPSCGRPIASTIEILGSDPLEMEVARYGR